MATGLNTVECVVFNVLSWNIDGLDSSNLVSRTNQVASILKRLVFFCLWTQLNAPESFSCLLEFVDLVHFGPAFFFTCFTQVSSRRDIPHEH